MANPAQGVPANDAASVAQVDLKLEIVVIPVADAGRAKEFYARLGWRFFHLKNEEPERCDEDDPEKAAHGRHAVYERQ